MSTSKGALENTERFQETKSEEKTFKVDKRNEKVFFNEEWIDAEEEKDTLYEILEIKRKEMSDLKNSFLQDFQKSYVEDKETRDVVRRIGKLSSDISELETILKN